MQAIIIILEFIHIVFGVFAIPIYRMWKGGTLDTNILLCWGLYILWAFIWCVILPVLCLQFSKELFFLFPESYGVVAIVFVGWIPSIFICSIAYAIIAVIKKRKCTLKVSSNRNL